MKEKKILIKKQWILTAVDHSSIKIENKGRTIDWYLRLFASFVDSFLYKHCQILVQMSTVNISRVGLLV